MRLTYAPHTVGTTRYNALKKDVHSASKTRSHRPGWSIAFRHPLRNDARGRAGLKMRRGLGTSDDAEADAMVAVMNIILSDQAWWNASKRKEAELRFSRAIVEAFYDEIQAGRDDEKLCGKLVSTFRMPRTMVTRACCSLARRVPAKRRYYDS